MSQTSDQATFAKSMFSSQPFVILCNNRVVFGFLLFVSLALNFYAWSTLHMMVNLGLPSFSHYKFIALERRDGGFLGSNSTGGPGVLRFGLSDGLKTVESCDGGQTTSITADGSMLLSFNYAGAKRAARWSGWYIITSTEEGSQDRDPVSLPSARPISLRTWRGDVIRASPRIAEEFSILVPRSGLLAGCRGTWGRRDEPLFAHGLRSALLFTT